MGIYTEGLKELLADNGFQSYVSTRSLSVGQYHNSTIVFPSDLACDLYFVSASKLGELARRQGHHISLFASLWTRMVLC